MFSLPLSINSDSTSNEESTVSEESNQDSYDVLIRFHSAEVCFLFLLLTRLHDFYSETTENQFDWPWRSLFHGKHR